MSKKSNSILDDILEYGPKILELATAVLDFIHKVDTMWNDSRNNEHKMLEDEEFDRIKNISDEREYEQLPELPVYATESQSQPPYQQQMYPNNYNTFTALPYQQMPQQQIPPQQPLQQQPPQQNCGVAVLTISVPIYY